MARKVFSALIFTIIGLAAIGLVSQLFTNTVSFFTNIFIMLGVGIVLFAVFYFVFIKKRTPSNDMKKYKIAVKQSKAKYKDPKSSTHTIISNKKNSTPQKKKWNKRAPHLRVIDGNKSKGKDRATF